MKSGYDRELAHCEDRWRSSGLTVGIIMPQLENSFACVDWLCQPYALPNPGMITLSFLE